MESSVMTIRTKCDRSWPLLKLIDEYSEYQTDIRMYEDTDEIEVRFVLRKILGSTKLTRKIFLNKAKKALL